MALDVLPPAGVELKEIAKVSSLGPSLEVIEVAQWAAHRYCGGVAKVLRTASPDTMTSILPSGPAGVAPALGAVDPLIESAFAKPGVTMFRVAPTSDLFPFLVAAAALGDSLVITPSVAEARMLGAQVRRAGARVSLAGRDWGLGAAGGMVVGARKAVFSTVRSLACVVVLDENDESLQEERTPTWHAREVAIERARRAGVPCVLVSAAPSLAGLAAADQVISLSRSEERAGWPLVQICDRRSDDPTKGGLFSSELVKLLRITSGRVLCILNRKGRANMLACASCGELVRSHDGHRLMTEAEGRLVGGNGESRPLICLNCNGTSLKRLRLGVGRAREELQALAREPVAEVTADTMADAVGSARILIGTEALLHRVNQAEAVVFLDFDQELLAPRYRAAEQAMTLIVRAGRILPTRSASPRGTILIQTRTPTHRVLRSAQEANPDRMTAEEQQLRRSSELPPFGALAEVGGAGASEFLAPLLKKGKLPNDHATAVLGPRDDGRFLVKAADPSVLADILAGLTRPKARTRIVVDPPRA